MNRPATPSSTAVQGSGRAASPRPLRGVRVLSLALNLPGPAALQRCRALGATCIKLEPPSGDPMLGYSPAAHAALHEGVRIVAADLKSDAGQRRLEQELARADVLLTSFRPSALARLGLGWRTLHRRHPRLCQVAIVGAPGPDAETPGHDLTYLAEEGLITGLDLPPTLYADMGGALLATEAVLRLLLARQASGRGAFLEVALRDAAAWLAQPRAWGLTTPDAAIGGAHAGYRVYACRDGRVAVAALEPHFARRLAHAAGLPEGSEARMDEAGTRQALQGFFAGRTRRQLDALARRHDLPLHTLPR